MDSKQNKETQIIRKTKPIIFWNVAEVCKWLIRHAEPEGQKYSKNFESHCITGRCLTLITEEHLMEMGISTKADRIKLLKHIYRLRLKHDLINLNK